MQKKECKCTSRVYQVTPILPYRDNGVLMVGYQVNQICAECYRAILVTFVTDYAYNAVWLEGHREALVGLYCD